MTDNEINDAVARGLGWKILGPEFGGWMREGKHQEHRQHIPDYCHSIAAAWEIVDKIPAWDLVAMDGEIQARLYLNGKTEMANADTAPMAICLAFLKVP